jgi:hypothetical protein
MTAARQSRAMLPIPTDSAPQVQYRHGVIDEQSAGTPAVSA